MIVGIDVTAATAESVSGVGYHIIRLLEALDRESPPDIRFLAFFQAVDSAHRKRAAARLPASSRTAIVPVPFVKTTIHALHRAFARVILPAAAQHHRCDVFHGPSHVIPRLRRIPAIVTIHDLAFFKHDLYEPAFAAALRQAVAASIDAADAVIALSENTRRDLHAITGRTENVHVIYGAGNYATAAASRRMPGDVAALSKVGVSKPYVLYVGDFNARKNIPYLIESFACFRRCAGSGQSQLVLVGNSHDVRAALDQEIRRVGLTGSDVIVPGRVADDLIPVLYRNAAAFALCSIMEGFTLVTLEAMSYGVPVVATDTSSIAEGTGTAAELVPLNDPQAVARALQVAVLPSARRDEMIRLGFERAVKFSWATAASRTLALYIQTIEDRRGKGIFDEARQIPRSNQEPVR